MLGHFAAEPNEELAFSRKVADFFIGVIISNFPEQFHRFDVVWRVAAFLGAGEAHLGIRRKEAQEELGLRGQLALIAVGADFLKILEQDFKLLAIRAQDGLARQRIGQGRDLVEVLILLDFLAQDNSGCSIIIPNIKTPQTV